jgi:hypothetical protein
MLLTSESLKFMPIPISYMTGDDLADIVSHHAPDPEQIAKIIEIRAAALNFLQVIRANCPPSAASSLAMQHVLDAMMRSNQAIVLKGKL